MLLSIAVSTAWPRCVTSPAGTFRVETPLLGTGNLLNLLAAAAVAHRNGCRARRDRRTGCRHAPRRRTAASCCDCAGGITLIDDSYNSSPAALKRSLETVAAATGSARKVAVLGEMLELGAHADRLHAECGRAAAESGLALLIAVGGEPAQALAFAAARTRA